MFFIIFVCSLGSMYVHAAPPSAGGPSLEIIGEFVVSISNTTSFSFQISVVGEFQID